MEVAVSSWSWHEPYYQGRWSLLDLCRSATGLGISLIECNDFMLPPPRYSRIRRPLLSLLPGATPELWRYSRASFDRLQQAAHTHGATILAWAINSDFAVPAHHWPAQQLYLRLGLLACKRVGARLLRLNLGGRSGEPESTDEVVVQRLARFVKISQQRYPGLIITVENHWGLSTDPDRHLRLLARTHNLLAPSLQAFFGACFDPGNLPRGDRRRWWKGLARLANHYHFKTTAFDADGNDMGLPHAYLLALLRQAGYSGKATIEFTGDGDPAEGVRQSLALFRRLAAS